MCGRGLAAVRHYAWGRPHAVIVCVWCGSMRAHCCAVRPNREWGGRLGVGPHVAVTVSTVIVTYKHSIFSFGPELYPARRNVQRPRIIHAPEPQPQQAARARLTDHILLLLVLVLLLL